MRQVADVDRIRRFIHVFGAAADVATRIYFTGGATAVLLGWRESTIDVDIKVEPDTDALFQRCESLSQDVSAAEAHYGPVASE